MSELHKNSFLRVVLHRAILLGTAAASLPTQAADPVLDPVVVTATRRETLSDSVPATITVERGPSLERRVLADDADLFHDEPDVVVSRDLRRFGATRVNIRGIEDSRVVQLVDGVRIADFHDGGGPSNFTMSASLGVSPAFLKQVEVLRGPASSLYGSDALGGVVGYLTLDADDLLEDGATRGGRYRLSFNGANKSLGNALLGAWRGREVSLLLGYSNTSAEAFDNRGNVGGASPRRSRPNPQNVDDRAALAKLEWRPTPEHRVGVTLEGRVQKGDTEVLRLNSTLPKVTHANGKDRSERGRLSVEWEHRPAQGFYHRMLARVHSQRTDTDNRNTQRRSNTGATCSAARGFGNQCAVDQRFEFTQSSVGLGLQFESLLDRGALPHYFTYGVDLTRVESSSLRDATVHNLTTATHSKSLAGDAFPLRDFPDGQTDSVGVFIEDEIALADEKVILTPSLRYDWRRLEPQVDVLAARVLMANGRRAAEQTDAAFSPKLAALWKLTPTVSVYGQIVKGFRAPNYEEVNGSFRNSVQRYGISPNPDLKPETSTGYEIGLKLNTGALRSQLALFDNRYRDFIEQVRLGCPQDPDCIPDLAATFMSRNLSKVRIYGAELRTQWNFRPGWRLSAGMAWAHGTDEGANAPLNSVEPARMTLSLLRDAGQWGAQAHLRAAARKSRVDDRESATVATEERWFRTPGYAVVDVAAWWYLAPRARLQVGVSNLFNQTYWLWSDIRQADARNPEGVAFYSQPGRRLNLSFNYQF